MKHIYFITLLLGTIFLAGCVQEVKQDIVQASFDQPFSLYVQQKARIHYEGASKDYEGLTLTFMNVTEDSRCPEGVQCVWEGQVSVNVHLQKGTQDLGIISFTSRGGAEDVKDVGDYSETLVKVEPYPTKDVKITSYRATFLISEFTLYSGGGESWVQIDPVQCGGNPWQQYWEEQRKKACPDASKACPFHDIKEEAIIQQYYRTQGIEVSDVKSRKTHAIVCMACSCPRGDTLYLFVNNRDVEQMVKLGYKRSISESFDF